MYLTSYHIEAIILGGLAAVVGFCVLLLASRWTVRFGKGGRRGGWKPGFAASGPGDAASQLRHVTSAPFFKKKVMSKAEYRVFRIVEMVIGRLGKGCRVLSQTSLGEVIGSDDEQAFASINSKRVDILIIGPSGEPIAAIEYQGSGHYQGTAAVRDAIKREALRKAGVRYIEVGDDHSPVEVAGMVRRLFEFAPAASPFAAERR